MIVKEAQCYCNTNRYSPKSYVVFIMGHVQKPSSLYAWIKEKYFALFAVRICLTVSFFEQIQRGCLCQNFSSIKHSLDIQLVFWHLTWYIPFYADLIKVMLMQIIKTVSDNRISVWRIFVIQMHVRHKNNYLFSPLVFFLICLIWKTSGTDF